MKDARQTVDEELAEGTTRLIASEMASKHGAVYSDVANEMMRRSAAGSMKAVSLVKRRGVLEFVFVPLAKR